MPFNRGNVVLVLFPDSNLRTAKRRPAIVVQRSDLRTGLPQIILAMISSNPVAHGHPSRVSIGKASPEGAGNGLTDRLDRDDG